MLRTSRCVVGIITACVLFSVMFLFVVNRAFAAPACDRPFDLRQPSGKAFEARQRGDEWYNWVETKDGYGIYKNAATGNWEYYVPAGNGTGTAAVGANGRSPLQGTRRPGRMQDAPKRSIVGEADPATLGIPKGLRPPKSQEKLRQDKQDGRDRGGMDKRRDSEESSSAREGRLGEAERTQQPMKTTAVSGTRYLLVIGVDYATTTATYKPSEVQALAFGASNSVADYYNDVSYSAVTIEPATESEGTSNDGFIGWLRLSGSHPGYGSSQIAKDAILAADAYIDYSAYDADGDGYVEPEELSIIIIVAGYEGSYGGSYSPYVWAHQSSMYWVGYPKADGKTLQEYAMFGEIHKDHLATFGVIAHELGHLTFSLPDLYDTDYSSMGIGYFDLMGGGGWGAASGAYSGSSPTHLSAWGKEYLSWGTVNTISSGQSISLPKADGNKSSIFRVNTQDSNQYFLLENRAFSGYDAGFQSGTGASGHGGLVIYHIDKTKTDLWPSSNTVNQDEDDKGVDVEEANEGSLGYSMLDTYTDSADTNMFFFSGNNTTFTNDTTPDSRLKSGGSTHISVKDVSAYGDTMTAAISLPTTQTIIVSTDSTTDLTTSSVTLQGTVNTNGVTTTVWFEYGTASGSYNSSTATQTVSSTSSTTASATISGLPPYTIYHYQLVAQTTEGTRWDGGGKEFATLMDSAITVTPKIAAGHYYTLALNSGSTVWAWGYNKNSPLGDGTASDRTSPVQMHGLSGITALDGSWHSLALRSDGTVWGCGYNRDGRLGDGTKRNRKIPVQIKSLSNIIAIAVGNWHSLVLRSDGTVWAWGDNSYGQLGDGTTTDRSAPAQVNGLSDIIAIAAGGAHNLALKADGTVWAWGYNEDGELGDGTRTTTSPYGKTTPVQVNGISGAIAIAGGQYHSLALKSDGTIWAWGYNYGGELGDGTTTTTDPYGKLTPVQVSSLSGVTAIAASKARHSLALKSDGTVWAWGVNWNGQLGDGTTTNKSTPVQVSSLSDITAIAIGGNGHSLALKSDGTVWAWGNNRYGQIGNGTTNTTYPYNQSTPAQVKNINLGKTSVNSTGPTGSISINGGASYTNSTTVTLNLSATDAYGVTGYYLSTSSTTPSSSDSGWTSVSSSVAYSGTASYTFSGGEGTKTVYAWYKNTLGNVSSPVSGSIILDETAPTVTITGPTADATYSTTSGTITLAGSASDTASGISSVAWSNNKGGNGTANGTAKWTALWITLLPGENVITVTATDGAGNTGTDAITVTYAKSLPPTPTPTPARSPIPTPSPIFTPPPQASGIFGFVYDGDERPVGGVTVAITGASYSGAGETDSIGYYEFKTLPPGDYRVTYTKSGYQTAMQDVRLGEGETREIVAIMEPAVKGKIAGHVEDIYGNAVESARIKLTRGKPRTVMTVFTDDGGYFEFTDLEAGAYTIVTYKKGYKKSKKVVKLEEGEGLEITIEMKKTAKGM